MARPRILRLGTVFPRIIETMVRRERRSIRGLLGLALIFGGAPSCRGDLAHEDVGHASYAGSVGGCDCRTSGGCSELSYDDIPADGLYYVTTFGGGSDTQTMACGGVADGTWAYVADKARFGCGAKVRIAAQGRSCIAEVADCGPNKCVEEAACSCSCADHHPIIDASPFITEHLLGLAGVGWSDRMMVEATLVDQSTVIGCPGGPVPQLDAATEPSVDAVMAVDDAWTAVDASSRHPQQGCSLSRRRSPSTPDAAWLFVLLALARLLPRRRRRG